MVYMKGFYEGVRDLTLKRLSGQNWSAACFRRKSWLLCLVCLPGVS